MVPLFHYKQRMANIAGKAKALRLRSKFSLREMAVKLGVSHVTLWRFEQGLRINRFIFAHIETELEAMKSGKK